MAQNQIEIAQAPAKPASLVALISKSMRVYLRVSRLANGHANVGRMIPVHHSYTAGLLSVQLVQADEPGPEWRQNCKEEIAIE